MNRKNFDGKNRWRRVYSSSSESWDSDSGIQSPVRKRKCFQDATKKLDSCRHLINRPNNSKDSGNYASQPGSPMEPNGGPVKPPRQDCSAFLDETTSCSSSHTSDGDSESFEETPVTPEEAGHIYVNCLTLYQARKINAYNAFKLKLVECITAILNLEQLRNNMLLKTHVVEIGAKIYCCRVDHTYTKTCTTVELVSRLNEMDAKSFETEESEEERPIVVRRNHRHASRRFVADDDAKLNTQFNFTSADAALRRNSLRRKFSGFINEDLDFDYLSYFKTFNEHDNLPRLDQLCDRGGLYIDNEFSHDEPATVPWLPFNFVTDFDPAILDDWGQPLDCENGNNLISILQIIPSEPESDHESEFKYNRDRPQARENSVARFVDEETGPDEIITDSVLGQEIEIFANLECISSLDDLKKLFEALNPTEVSIHPKYGWQGVKYYNFQPPDFSKGRKRKRHGLKIANDNLNLENIFKGYKFPKNPSNLLLSDNTLSTWINKADRLLLPRGPNFEEYEHFAAIASEDYFKKFTTFFNDPNRSIDPVPTKESQFNLSPERPGDQNDNSMEVILNAEDEVLFDSFNENFINSDSIMRLIPDSLRERWSIYETEQSIEIEEQKNYSKYIKQPKPVDMRLLQNIILDILKKELCLTDDCLPTSTDEKRMEFLQLVVEIIETRAMQRLALANITIPLIVIGLLHVVANAKLFLVPSKAKTGLYNPVIVSYGKNWRHEKNIPGLSEDNCPGHVEGHVVM